MAGKKDEKVKKMKKFERKKEKKAEFLTLNLGKILNLNFIYKHFGA